VINSFRAQLVSFIFDELNQLPPDALVFVRRIDKKTRNFALLLRGI
jgi:hypothetical protein